MKYIFGVILAVTLGVVIRLGFYWWHSEYDVGSSIVYRVDDHGAGPIMGPASPCYRAQVQKKAAKHCEPPSLAGESATVADRVTDHLKRAVYFAGMQDFKSALQEADGALSLDSRSLDAHHLASRLAFTLQDLDRAEREAVAALRISPTDPQVGTNYAIVMMGRRTYGHASQLLDDVVKNHPQFLFAREERARLNEYVGQCCDRSRVLTAIKDVTFLIQRSPKESRLYGWRALLSQEIGRRKDALEDLEIALTLEPDSIFLFKQRAEVRAADGDDAGAVRDFDAILAFVAPGVPLHAMLDNDRAKLLSARAISLVRINRLKDAAEDALVAIAVGGKPAILRAQILLRRNGFPDVPIDGVKSDELRDVLTSCFSFKSCFDTVMHSI